MICSKTGRVGADRVGPTRLAVITVLMVGRCPSRTDVDLDGSARADSYAVGRGILVPFEKHGPRAAGRGARRNGLGRGTGQRRRRKPICSADMTDMVSAGHADDEKRTRRSDGRTRRTGLRTIFRTPRALSAPRYLRNATDGRHRRFPGVECNNVQNESV